MPKKKKFEFEAVLLAAGAGMATNPLMDLLQDQVFKKKPEVVPAVTLAAGLALQYFGGEKLQPAALGIIAVSAGDLASGLLSGAGSTTGKKSFDLSGFSRVNVSSTPINNIPENFAEQMEDFENEWQDSDDGTE